MLPRTTAATSSSSRSEAALPTNRASSSTMLSYAPLATTGLPGSNCCAGQNWGSISFMGTRHPADRFMFSPITRKRTILRLHYHRTSTSGHLERRAVRLQPRPRAASTRLPPLRDRFHPSSVGVRISTIPAGALPRRCTSPGHTSWYLKLQARNHSREYTSKVARSLPTGSATPC